MAGTSTKGEPALAAGDAKDDLVSYVPIHTLFAPLPKGIPNPNDGTMMIP